MKVPNNHLLAKSLKSGTNPVTLVQHCKDVANAFEALFGQRHIPKRLGMQWLRFFRLKDNVFESFHANGYAACILHDLGKANDGFQEMVQRHSQNQYVRHEHLSAFLLSITPLADWIRHNELLNHTVIVSAVLGHHLKASWKRPTRAEYHGMEDPRMFGNKMFVYTKHRDFLAILQTLSKDLGIRLPKELDISCRWDEDKVCDRQEIKRLGREVESWNNENLKLLRAVKAAVIVADAAGSGLVREGVDIVQWIGERFTEGDDLLSAEDIENKVIVPRINQIKAISSKRSKEIPDRLQRAATDFPARTLLLAPCGSGKTLAAWYWIRGQLQQHPASRVLFLYPTRGTATEGFKDYVSHAPETDASLLTGTARYELTDMFTNPDDEHDRQHKDFAVDARLFKLAYWNKRIFSATVHQFLSFMQQDYGGMCLLPVLVDSIVVVDEVHSFTPELFSALQCFLKEFNVPVLCITASLTQKRRHLLQKVEMEVRPDDPTHFERIEKLAKLQRYRVHNYPESVDSKAEILDYTKQELQNHKRVLWVVNTVDRCQKIAQELADWSPICYHSRFRLKDRKRQHEAVINKFKRKNGTVLAITTQVCEMSLDLDADILITELAPMSSLIQRMGRCNRHEPETGGKGDVYIYPPTRNVPYDDEEMRLAREFVNALVDHTVSQRRLEELLEKFSKEMPQDGVNWQSFIDDKFWAKGGEHSLMGEDQYTVSAILSCDVEQYMYYRRTTHPKAEELILPAPRKLVDANVDRRLPRYLSIVPASFYCKEYGLMKDTVARETIIL